MVLAILTATALSFVVSAVLYGLPPVAALVARESTPRLGLSMAVVVVTVLARSFVVACLVAGLMAAGEWSAPAEGVLLGLALGVIPVTILSGAVVHEGTSVRLAGVHSLDWVAKLAVIGAIIGLLG